MTKTPPSEERLAQVLRWVMETSNQQAIASADWLARDINDQCNSAVDLLISDHTTLVQLRQAKSVFKTMRIVGETSADRRIGARLYAASIAAGLVRFNQRISRQSNRALLRGFTGLLNDRRMSSNLRDLAGMALCMLKDQKPEFEPKQDIESDPCDNGEFDNVPALEPDDD